MRPLTFWVRALGSCTIAAFVAPAAADTPAPPTLDCIGFEVSRAAAAALPGATAERNRDLEIFTTGRPDAWTVEYAFTFPGHPAHSAAVLRTRIKQVTGVWTAQSKGCGYGDQTAFAALMSDMKARDKELTEASRAEVENQRRAAPFGSVP